MRVIGIDPGVNGAIAVLSKAGSMLDMEPMPESGPIGLLKFFKEEWIGHVFLEKAQAFRGQGVSSSFNYGQHIGSAAQLDKADAHGHQQQAGSQG